jgi:tryptophan synthase alpha chain
VGSALVQNFADIDANDSKAVAEAQQRIMTKMNELRDALDSL